MCLTGIARALVRWLKTFFLLSYYVYPYNNRSKTHQMSCPFKSIKNNRFSKTFDLPIYMNICITVIWILKLITLNSREKLSKNYAN